MWGSFGAIWYCASSNPRQTIFCFLYDGIGELRSARFLLLSCFNVCNTGALHLALLTFKPLLQAWITLISEKLESSLLNYRDSRAAVTEDYVTWNLCLYLSKFDILKKLIQLLGSRNLLSQFMNLAMLGFMQVEPRELCFALSTSKAITALTVIRA